VKMEIEVPEQVLENMKLYYAVNGFEN